MGHICTIDASWLWCNWRQSQNMPSVADPLPTFSDNLRKTRREKGLSQERLAHASGLNMTHVARIERGEREPGVRTVSKLTKGLGVSAAILFDGIDGR